MNQLPNTLRVKLIKNKQSGFGFLVKERATKPCVIVSGLLCSGMAEESGLIQVGDTILRINDIDLIDMSYESAIEILKAVPVDTQVTLLLRGPDGHTTHLETIYLENGIPLTVRITKPVAPEDSLLNRIRRTFSPNPSPQSSINNLKMLCGNRTPSKSKRKNSPHRSHNTDSDKDKTSCKADISPCDGCPNIAEIKENGLDMRSHPNQMKDNRGAVAQIGLECQTNVTADGQHTLLDNKSDGSPKIVLTKPSPSGALDSNENYQESTFTIQRTNGSSPTKRTIEILQDNDEITIVIKGDIRIKNEGSTTTPQSSPRPENIKKNVPENARSHEHNGSVPDGERIKKEERRTSLQSPNQARKLSDRRGSVVASPKKFSKLRNLLDERKTVTDKLHIKAMQTVSCTPEKCTGSMLSVAVTRPNGLPRSKDEVLIHAKDLIDQYYESMKRLNTPAYHKRWQEIQNSVEQTSTYELSTSELTFGAKTGWRNSPRCIGRIQWTKLQVFDARHITTARGMFEAICNHIKYATNKGNIRSAITVFPPRTDCRHDYRVWSAQYIRYAGYKLPDGSIMGDPASVEFTELCQKMGWKPKGGMFDILPLIISANGHDPEMFDIPPDLILEIPLKHPKYPWFEELGLKWYALPAVAGMMFDCGGLEFTAAPFNGWYMGTEIGARNLCDPCRYNLTEKVAKRMGLDVRKSSSLWRDLVLVEMNIAILYSYQSANVTITDHHTAAESFMKHLENEQRSRGGCPADWVWIVPPISGSITPVFHQEMLNYCLKPSFEYQDDPSKTHIWKKDRDKVKSLDRPKRKFGFREIARAVKFSAKLMGKALARRVKCTIMYATETGKSERFARSLCEIFKHAFDAKVMCLDNYDVIDLEHETLVLVITSTFGNGDPPENGEQFAKGIYALKHPSGLTEDDFTSTSYIRMSVSSEPDMTSHSENVGDDNLRMETGTLGNVRQGTRRDHFARSMSAPAMTRDCHMQECLGLLSNVRYGVFGLGSKAYPNFCAFACYIDKVLGELGGERIYKMTEGDELCGQEESFKNWAEDVFKAACETFCLGDDVNIKEATDTLSKTDISWSPDKFRLTPIDHETEMDICAALSKLHRKTIMPCKLANRCQLQAKESSRQTIFVTLDTQGASELMYDPGDHVGAFPTNNPAQVDLILSQLHNAPPKDQLIKVEILQEKPTPLGNAKHWVSFEKIPPCTLQTAFSRFLDFTTPPSQRMMQLLATQATHDEDRERMEHLAQDSQSFEDWKYSRQPTLIDVLKEFTSLKVSVSLLVTQLPLLLQRYYSISSSPKMSPGEIDLTIAVVKYQMDDGNGPHRYGICSNWLCSCNLGEVVPCLVRTAPAFQMPDDGTVPLILVGPGTGIAPFRSFWQQRKIDKEMISEPKSGDQTGWSDITLYFGCRQKNIDDIYKDELEQLVADGILKAVYKAYSREPNTPKMYVQDVMLQHSQDIYRDIFQKRGHFYVCGDVSMAQDVSKTLEIILRERGGLPALAASKYVFKLRDDNRFHEDIFGVNFEMAGKSERQRHQSHEKKVKFDDIKENGEQGDDDVMEDNKISQNIGNMKLTNKTLIKIRDLNI